MLVGVALSALIVMFVIRSGFREAVPIGACVLFFPGCLGSSFVLLVQVEDHLWRVRRYGVVLVLRSSTLLLLLVCGSSL